MAYPSAYQPATSFTSGLPAGMMDSASAYAMAQPMMSQPQFPAEMAQPELTERYSADMLYRMYMSWELAKGPEIQEQFTSSRYYHTKQWTDEEIKTLRRRKQPITTENITKRKVDFLVGVEQRLRRDPKAFPRNPMAEKAAPVATAVLRDVCDQNKWPSIASECCNDGMVRGIGAIWQGAEVIGGKAEVKKKQIKADRFFYDPRSENWDFSDAAFLGEHQWLDMAQAKRMLPWAKEMIEGLANSGGWGASAFGSLPQEFAKARNWDTWVDFSQRRIRLVSIWYQGPSGDWMFDYLVGEVSLCPKDMDCKSPYWGEDYSEENPTTDHPYRAWSPYVDESGIRYGVMRDLIPIQDAINKRSSKLLYQLTVRQTMGVAGAVDDIGAMKQEMAKPDGHVVYNEVGNGTQPSFQIVDQSQQIQGQFELLQQHKDSIQNLGPNPALVGQGVENQSGRAILAQQNSGMTELSPVFERMREWKLAVYRKDWCLVRQFKKGEHYIRVTGDPRAVEFLNINVIHYDEMTGQVQVENSIAEMDVDIIMDEGPDTVTVREELTQQLAQMGPGVVPPEILIEMSDIPDKEYLLKRLQESRAPPPEIVAMQERMAALEELLKAAQADKTIADADAQRAATLKTLGEIMAPKPAPSAGGGKPGGSAKPGAAKAPAPAPAPPKDPDAIINELMMASNVMSQAFPVYYREPTNVDMIKMAGPPGGQPQPNGPPDNAMMGGQQADQEGAMGPDAMEANALMPDPRTMQEPQLGGPGGLPLGPGV